MVRLVRAISRSIAGILDWSKDAKEADNGTDEEENAEDVYYVRSKLQIINVKFENISGDDQK